MTNFKMNLFCEKLQSVRYNAVTGAMQGTFSDKMYQELGLETLKSRGRYKSLRRIFKITNEEAPHYLISLIPKCQRFIRTRNCQIPNFHCRTDCFTYSFFPSSLNDWFNLDDSIRNSKSISNPIPSSPKQILQYL